MPRKGYVSVMGTSFPQEIVDAVEKLRKNPKFIADMKAKGHFKVTRALVFRIAIQEYLKSKGLDIAHTSEAEGKQRQQLP